MPRSSMATQYIEVFVQVCEICRAAWYIRVRKCVGQVKKIFVTCKKYFSRIILGFGIANVELTEMLESKAQS